MINGYISKQQKAKKRSETKIVEAVPNTVNLNFVKPNINLIKRWNSVIRSNK